MSGPLVLSDVEKAALQGMEWLGIDFDLGADGDFQFGGDGDWVLHTHPVESFGACLKHAMQVAAASVFLPSHPTRAIRAALKAAADDPRIREVKLVDTQQGTSSDGTTDLQFLILTLRLTLISGDTLDNAVFPLTFEAGGN